MLTNKFPSRSAPRDKIPTTVFKKVSHLLAVVISELFNMSIREGVFPSCRKIGRVIPISKLGKKDSLNNYRPVTTSPIFAKIFEKLAHKSIMSFISQVCLLNCN